MRSSSVPAGPVNRQLFAKPKAIQLNYYKVKLKLQLYVFQQIYFIYSSYFMYMMDVRYDWLHVAQYSDP